MGLKDASQRLELHKLLRLRQRYILTKNNRLRLRYVVGGSLCVLTALAMLPAGMGLSLNPQGGSALELAMGDAPAYNDIAVAAVENEADAVLAVQTASAANDEIDPVPAASSWTIAESIQNEISSSIRKASLSIKKAVPENGEITIGKGDTVAGALEEAGVDSDEAFQVVAALGKHVDMREVQPGQILNVRFAAGGSPETAKVERLTMEVDPLQTVTLTRDGDTFNAKLDKKDLETKTYAGYAKIQSSLYGSAERAGIPPAVLAHVIKLYSRTIDFQRDIRQGDEIEVLYDGQQTEDGEYKRTGNVIFANLTIGGKQVPIYRFENDDGSVDYYDEKGRTTRKTLLKTPIDGARMSSGFGMRRHPILGYSKMHKGVDFAAPTGTPIYAAGDGVVDFAGRKSGYGNYIALRHTSQYKTAYAHMYKFAKGMRPGVRVKQGDVIGYVGSTGRSTGPHLHYEVIVSGRQVNPRSVDLPVGENLKGTQLAKFRRTMGSIRQQYASLVQGVKVAQGAGDTSSGNGG